MAKTTEDLIAAKLGQLQLQLLVSQAQLAAAIEELALLRAVKKDNA